VLLNATELQRILSEISHGLFGLVLVGRNMKVGNQSLMTHDYLQTPTWKKAMYASSLLRHMIAEIQTKQATILPHPTLILILISDPGLSPNLNVPSAYPTLSKATKYGYCRAAIYSTSTRSMSG
jgi:hypothetical protein